MSKSNAKLEPVYPTKEDAAYRFFKTPKVLFYSSVYRTLSIGAKTLYFILLDRMELSKKNQWVDENGDFFVLFKGKPAQNDTRNIDEKPWEALSLTEVLNVDQRTLRKYKDELIRHELLIEKRSGLGRYNRLYVKPQIESIKPPRKEASEPSVSSGKRESFSIHKIHKLLEITYGKESLEKALAYTEGHPLPLKGYYSSMANIIEESR
jgi:hypothetical protein